MKTKTLLRLTIAGTCLFLASSCASHRSAPNPAVRPLAVCELVGASTQYRNTIVTVRGRVVSGFEMFGLVSDQCQTDGRAAAVIWLKMPGADDIPYAEGVTTSEFVAAVGEKRLQAWAESLTWCTPVPVKFEKTSEWNRLERALARSGSVTATLTGRLDYADGLFVTRLSNGSMALSGGFGHLNGHSRQLVIQRVDDVR